MQSDIFDVIIIGGGIMGSATAYNLMKYDNGLKIVVIEMDPTYTHASTTLSLSNVRIQFSLRENIAISQYAFEVLESFSEEMAVGDNVPKTSFRREGNLFLFSPEAQAIADMSLDLQHSMGCQVERLSPENINTRFPMYSIDGIAGGTFGSADGHFDAHAVLMGYKAKARSLGARYLHDKVVAIVTSGGRVTGVRLKSGHQLNAGYVANCAGAWASEIARSRSSR